MSPDPPPSLSYNLVDARYELPVDFRVTDASAAEQPVAHEIMDELADRAPLIVTRTQYLIGDRGYDDGKLIRKAYDTMNIAPVIDIRNLWRDGERLKMVPGTENVAYDYSGTVVCMCPTTWKEHEMRYGGFEKKRGTHKYLCPAKHLGIHCEGEVQCKVGRQIRIPITEDRRVFPPVARIDVQVETALMPCVPRLSVFMLASMEPFFLNTTVFVESEK